MGLAPAPHLGGLSGSPGSAARSEEEAARRKRVLEATRPSSSAPPPAQSRPPGQEEVVERVPPAFTGPPPPPAAHPTQPAFGTTTMLMFPKTPDTPLTLPEQAREPQPELPPSGGWEIAAPEQQSSPGVPSAPTVLVEPAVDMSRTAAMAHAPSYAQQQPHGAYAQPPRSPHPSQSPPRPQHEQVPEVEAAPVTARMVRPASPVDIGAPAPATALAVRTYEPSYQRHALSGRLDERLVLLNEPDSARAASFRVLRDSLLGKNLPRVVAVSSARQRDGKTTCAVNLALALAEQASTRVLLVDANFFAPELARIFTLDQLGPLNPSEPWLAPYTICAITNSLHVAGIVHGDHGRRFEQHRFDAMIDQLCRASYDYIIIDTPALAGAPAVRTLLGGADGTILTVRTGGTTTRELRQAAEQIPPNKALGVALMDANP